MSIEFLSHQQTTSRPSYLKEIMFGVPHDGGPVLACMQLRHLSVIPVHAQLPSSQSEIGTRALFFATLIEPCWNEENEVDTLLFNRPDLTSFRVKIRSWPRSLSDFRPCRRSWSGRLAGLARCAFGAHCKDTGIRRWLSSRPVS